MVAVVSVFGIRGWGFWNSGIWVCLVPGGQLVLGTGAGFVGSGAPQPQAGGEGGSGAFSLPRRTCTPRRRTRSCMWSATSAPSSRTRSWASTTCAPRATRRPPTDSSGAQPPSRSTNTRSSPGACRERRAGVGGGVILG